MIFKVYIQRIELNRCVNEAVQKTFLMRIWKEIYPAINRLISISGMFASKTQKKRLFQTALMCVCRGSEIFSLGNLETDISSLTQAFET